MPNLIAQPRKWRNKALLVKLEADYATDPVPTGAANWIQARNVNLVPMDVEKVARNIDQPYLGSSGQVLICKWAKLSFDIALAPSGDLGLEPKWAPLMLACGYAETVVADTSVAYNLISSLFDSITAWINIDGTRHKMTGGRGEVKCSMNAKNIPMLNFSLDFNYIAPDASALPAVTKTGWEREEGVNSANTIACTLDAIPLAYSMFEWSTGNKIARLDLPGPQREILIDDRAPQASMTVLAPGLAVFDPFAIMESEEVITFTTTHGSAAGKKVKIDIKSQITGVEYDQIDGQVAYKLMFEPEPSAGNDEIALTCL